MADNKVKAVSPLLASVVLIALVLTIGIFVSSSFSNIMQSEKEKTKEIQSCSQAGLIIEDVMCSNSILRIVIQNSGNVKLSDFKIYAKISGNLYTNTTPLNYNVTLTPGDAITLEGYTSYSGEVERVKAYSGTCPGVSAEVTNESIDVSC